MSNDSTPPTGGGSEHEHRPNWGSAYPPPGGAYPPPGYGYAYPPPKHPTAITSMVLGIVSVAGGLLCYLPLLIAPVAWFVSSRTIKEIDASQGAQTGRGEAMSGKVLGIIGTVILVLAIIAVVGFFVIAFSVDGFWDDDEYDYYGSALRSVLSGRGA